MLFIQNKVEKNINSKRGKKLSYLLHIDLHSLHLFVLHVEEDPGEVTGPHLLAEVATEFARGSHMDVAGMDNFDKFLYITPTPWICFKMNINI